MTRVKYCYSGNTYTLTIKGHATGSQKVCAAISAIAQSLEGWINNNRDKMITSEITKKSGEFRVYMKSDDKETRAVFDMAIIGFLSIEKGYGDYISVESE